MRFLVALALCAAIAAPIASGDTTAVPTLLAYVGKHDGFTISLTKANGKRVTSIPAGRYAIVVHDYSALHNFALGSATANKRIFTGSVTGIGTKTYHVTLVAGTYVYACSAHPTTMHGTFFVK